jgi:hypothetical protein
MDKCPMPPHITENFADFRVRYMFVHIVFFWLHPDSPDSAREQLIQDCRRFLGKIPVVRQTMVGRPAMTPRDVVDNSYDVGLCIIFNDMASHDLYQQHPLHQEFIAANKTYWKRVQVYDIQ